MCSIPSALLLSSRCSIAVLPSRSSTVLFPTSDLLSTRSATSLLFLSTISRSSVTTVLSSNHLTSLLLCLTFIFTASSCLESVSASLSPLLPIFSSSLSIPSSFLHHSTDSRIPPFASISIRLTFWSTYSSILSHPVYSIALCIYQYLLYADRHSCCRKPSWPYTRLPHTHSYHQCCSSACLP